MHKNTLSEIGATIKMPNTNEFKKLAKDLVSKMTIFERMEQLKYESPAIERLGVPAYNWWNECLHGVGRAGAATVFPQAIGMAASFNPQLMKRVATAISDEARAKYNQFRKFGSTEIYQGLTYWSPNINIFRDPRWGRGHETYGEDPYLTGRIGAAFIAGLQEGDDPKYRKLDATVKHYAVHSGPESIRHGFNVEPDKRDLWETYLSAFAYCIENVDPSAVMGAYNAIDGEPCCASPTMIGEVLRGKLNFKGYFVSDCGAVADIDKHHKKTENRAESAALALNSGCDLNCGSAYAALKAAYEEGLVSDEVITTACERLFEARFRLGMFDEECVYNKIPYSVVECKEHTDLNREMARESIVLCKNDGILPLKKSGKIAVIGPNADSLRALLGNYSGRPTKYTTPLRGIIDGCGNAEVMYSPGCHLYKLEPQVWDDLVLEKEAIVSAKEADVVIMVMGLTAELEGEQGDAYNSDYSGDRPDLDVLECQNKLFNTIAELGKPMIYVNVSGSAVNLCRQNEICNAVIQCFYPGAEGGNALADILFGEVSPSGRLPVTFYRSAEDLPAFDNYSMVGRTYKYFTGKPLYPFAYGLSYTTFDYTNASATRNGDGIDVTCTVSNTGDMRSDLVIPIFAKPVDRADGDPIVKLVNVNRITLDVGSKLTCTFGITADDMALYDENGDKCVRRGAYKILIGACSEEEACAVCDVELK